MKFSPPTLETTAMYDTISPTTWERTILHRIYECDHSWLSWRAVSLAGNVCASVTRPYTRLVTDVIHTTVNETHRHKEIRSTRITMKPTNMNSERGKLIRVDVDWSAGQLLVKASVHIAMASIGFSTCHYTTSTIQLRRKLSVSHLEPCTEARVCNKRG